MHAIIERTANFVCKQGAQFEIMLKAKQARNSQFDFLRFDHYLNPYYKFIQKAMKEGRYPVLAGDQRAEKQSTRGGAGRGRLSVLLRRLLGVGPGRAEVPLLPCSPEPQGGPATEGDKRPAPVPTASGAALRSWR